MHDSALSVPCRQSREQTEVREWRCQVPTSPSTAPLVTRDGHLPRLKSEFVLNNPPEHFKRKKERKMEDFFEMLIMGQTRVRPRSTACLLVFDPCFLRQSSRFCTYVPSFHGSSQQVRPIILGMHADRGDPRWHVLAPHFSCVLPSHFTYVSASLHIPCSCTMLECMAWGHT